MTGSELLESFEQVAGHSGTTVGLSSARWSVTLFACATLRSIAAPLPPMPRATTFVLAISPTRVMPQLLDNAKMAATVCPGKRGSYGEAPRQRGHSAVVNSVVSCVPGSLFKRGAPWKALERFRERGVFRCLGRAHKGMVFTPSFGVGRIDWCLFSEQGSAV
eukprot:scaffold25958_cov88-Phaeocystis_antarctica.AAC.1